VRSISSREVGLTPERPCCLGVGLAGTGLGSPATRIQAYFWHIVYTMSTLMHSYSCAPCKTMFNVAATILSSHSFGIIMSKLSNSRAIDEILSKKDVDIIESHLTIGSREARIRLGKIVENARREDNQFVVTEHGEPAAAIIPISDLRILDWVKKHNIKDSLSKAALHNMSFEEFKRTLESGEDNDAGGQQTRDKYSGAA